jgi:DNA modification methylase
MKGHDLYFGDWKIKAASLSDKCVDLMALDIPFGQTKQSWDKLPDFNLCWPEWTRIIKDNGVILIKCKAPIDKIVAASNMKMYKYDWVWEKNKATGHLNTGFMPLQAHEYIQVYYKNKPAYNAQMTDGHKPMNYAKKKPSNVYGHEKEVINNHGTTLRHPTTIIRVPVVNNDDPLRIHPNQTPVDLWRFFIRTYTNPGDTVADFYAGSFSVTEACIKEGRNSIACESNEKHFADGYKKIECRLAEKLST